MVAFYLGAIPQSPMTDLLGVGDQLLDMHQRGGNDPAALIAREMPDFWLDALGIAGDCDECAARISDLLAAGSDIICLCPAPSERSRTILELTARDVLPKVVRV